jgi:hypothetical protein
MKELESFGFPVHESVEIYTLDHRTMREQEKIRSEAGLFLYDERTETATLKDSWDEEDDCYFFVMNLSLEGLPVFSGTYGSVDDMTAVWGSTVWACYSARGFEYLSIQFPHRQIDAESAYVSLISIEGALTAFQKKFSNVIITDMIVVTEVSLHYVPTLIGQSREEYRMIPAWCFKIEEILSAENYRFIGGDAEVVKIYSTIIFDAVTGKEIL